METLIKTAKTLVKHFSLSTLSSILKVFKLVFIEIFLPHKNSIVNRTVVDHFPNLQDRDFRDTEGYFCMVPLALLYI